MKKAKASDELRPEYKREDLGVGVRGKYFEDYSKGTNLVLLSPDVAKAFSSDEAVNEALRSLIDLAEKSTGRTGHSTGSATMAAEATIVKEIRLDDLNSLIVRQEDEGTVTVEILHTAKRNLVRRSTSGSGLVEASHIRAVTLEGGCPQYLVTIHVCPMPLAPI